MSLVMSGRELAASIRSETAARAAELTTAGRTPTLAVVTATADEASAWYVRSLSRAAAKAGIACDVTDLGPASPSRPGSQDAAVEGKQYLRFENSDTVIRQRTRRAKAGIIQPYQVANFDSDR